MKTNRITIFLISNLSLALVGYCFTEPKDIIPQHHEFNEYSNNQGDQDRYDVPAKIPYPDVRSPLYLLELAEYETTVISVLGNLNVNFAHILSKEVIRKLDTYLKEYSQEILRAEKYSNVTPSTVLVAENPILAFNMIWRFAYALPKIRLLLQPFHSMIQDVAVKEFIGDERTAANWPSRKAFEEAMTGLLRIQMVYDLDPRELYSGVIYGVQTGAWLKIKQIPLLAEFAKDLKQYTQSIPWFELAIDELLHEQAYKELQETGLSQIQKMLNKTMEMHDAEWDDRGFDEYYFYMHKLIVDGEVDPERVPTRKMNFSSFRRSDKKEANEINYWSLCSGENHQTEAERANLSCWYDFSSPYLYINPNKLELLSDEPYIVQIYDAILESTSKRLIELTRLASYFSSSAEESQMTEFNYDSHGCTSVGGYVDGNETFVKLSKYMEASTRLSVVPVTASQKYLVMSYAYGGHYDCHLDARDAETMTTKDILTGNRVATITFYLKNARKGGFTAFPQAGIAVRPIKGSAVVWYNLKKSGETDEHTYHCACPVVLGHKTIATKWINHHDQFLNRPCGLRKDE